MAVRVTLSQKSEKLARRGKIGEGVPPSPPAEPDLHDIMAPLSHARTEWTTDAVRAGTPDYGEAAWALVVDSVIAVTVKRDEVAAAGCP